jgi:glycerate 2-kinase
MRIKNMKVVIATDSFKGCCTSMEAASAFEKGILNASPDAQIIKIPVADGGEGTVDAVVSGVGGKLHLVEATDPIGRRVSAQYGIIPNGIAVIEMAAASGLPLVPKEKRDPKYTTTFGTGEMIRDALDQGCRKIFIGIGGSATNDGGIGMAQALGVSFTDKNGKELGFGAGDIGSLAHIDISRLDARLSECEIVALCDVTNPLCGKTGATYIYGPQKGVKPEELSVLDSNLKHYASVILDQLGKDIADIPGAGAAGGLGAGLMTFCNARLKPGIETVLTLVGLETHLEDSDLVITGEGRIDGQSIFGKVPVGVARAAKKYNVPVIAIAGSIGDGAHAVYDYGIDSILSIVRGPISLEDSIANFKFLAEDAAERMMRIINIRIKQNQPDR